MKTAYRLTLELSVRGPLLCKSSDQLAFGVDSHSLYRVDAQGRRCAAIAGTHIKGQLRHALCELVKRAAPLPDLDPATLRQWFGPEQKDDDNAAEWEPRRALLQFSPYWLNPPRGGVHISGHTLHRIRIDETSGAVARGALLVIESALGVGEEATFRGDIHFRASEDEALIIQRWVGKAADWLTAVGSLKGVGFGQIIAAATTLQAEPDQTAAADTASSNDDALWITFGLDRPYCFAKAADRRGNRFDSEEFIPGAALRAALLQHAAQLAQGSDATVRALAHRVLAHNENLAFTHAHALDAAGKRPACLPQSLVRVGKKFYDLAHATEPALVDGKAPAFQIDWKSADFKAATEQLIPRSAIERRLSVRTAINAECGAAEDGALFALHTCDPAQHRFGAWLSWCGETNDAERAQTLDAARRLLPSALLNLGKTKARAVAPLCETRSRSGYVRAAAATWFVTLQSAAALTPDCPGLPFVNGSAALQQHYAESWRRLSDGALSLQAHFARQQVVGGRYLWERFWRKRSSAYQPELLSSAGSVFVLHATAGNDEKAAELLQRWTVTGLPTEQLLPATHRGWDRNPYQHQNGYGEILVNHAIHTDAALRPTQRELVQTLGEYAA